VRIGWESAGGTHIGRVRKANEDSFRIDEGHGLFLVADGMGGHAAGEVASTLAADAALEILKAASLRPEEVEDTMVAAFLEAQRKIVECCAGDPRTEGMGTTLTVAKLHPAGSVHIGHLGDSRLYRRREAELTQLTQDHTWVQREVEEGRLLARAARSHPFSHILTRVLTAADAADPDVFSLSVVPGDDLLICSDGLYNLVSDRAILEILSEASSAGDAVDQLIKAANRKGGNDNITAVSVRIN
jgi:serine/threonine protein phosphatase PrpC